MTRMSPAAVRGRSPRASACLGPAVLAVLLAAALAPLAPGATAPPAQHNTYAVTGRVAPQQAGSPAAPLPASMAVSTTFGEQSGLKPKPVKQLTWSFYGIRAEAGDRFPACTAAQIAGAGNSDQGCAAGSLVGTGSLTSFVYATSDPSGAKGGFACEKKVNVYNAGLRRTAWFFYGDPARCVGVGPLPAVAGDLIAGDGGGTALRLVLPTEVRHPIAGLSFALL